VFTYKANGADLTSVVVAGSFNSWATTSAQGAWPLTLNNGTWSGAPPGALTPGTYPYKFVIDGSRWVLDPTNPVRVSDGEGGENSVLSVTCSSSGRSAAAQGGAGNAAAGSAGGGAIDLTSAFPPEVRPTGFVYDDNGPARYVDLGLVTAYGQAASASVAAGDLSALVTCDEKADPASCARAFVTSFGLRAFRRPLVQAELDRYTRLLLNAQNGFFAGVALVVRAMLISPNFLYRFEVGVAQSDGTYHLTPYETASALSYTLWGTMPDQSLFDAAANGRLVTPHDIETEVRRLLADPRARKLVGVFASQWLGIENVTSLAKAPPYAAAFTGALSQAMLQETEQFVPYVMFDGSKRYDEVLTAAYTFASGSLATFYGIAGVTGPDLQKVTYPDAHRSGILGQASVLAANAYSDQSAPILRGLFVRKRLLCQTLPSPPANVPPLPPINPNASTRERVTEHAANAFCQTCHVDLDDLGFGFENFDAIGAWRTDDNGPIDSTGDMNDVEQLGADTHAPFTSLPQLAHILANSRAAPACFVSQYSSFARGYNAPSSCSNEALVARFSATGHDMQDMIVGLTTAGDFVVRQ
jgi:hypothetical protein